MTIPYARIRRFDRRMGRTATQRIGSTTESPRRLRRTIAPWLTLGGRGEHRPGAGPTGDWERHRDRDRGRGRDPRDQHRHHGHDHHDIHRRLCSEPRKQGSPDNRPPMAISTSASFFICSPEQNDSMREAMSQHQVRYKFCAPCLAQVPMGNQHAINPAAWRQTGSRSVLFNANSLRCMYAIAHKTCFHEQSFCRERHADGGYAAINKDSTANSAAPAGFDTFRGRRCNCNAGPVPAGYNPSSRNW